MFSEKELLATLPSLYRFAQKLVKTSEGAHDLLHDVVVRALTKQHQFETGTNLGGWMSRIMFNHFIGEKRKVRKLVEDPDDFYSLRRAVMPAQFDHMALQDFMKGLLTLPEAHQEVLLLMGIGGHKTDEVAEMLGVPEGTIKSRFSRARAAMKAFTPEDNPWLSALAA